jgi:hypothetical protein
VDTRQIANAIQFLYFSNTNNLFIYTRPYEALFRDPWWIFTCCNLLWNIKTRYEFGYFEIVRASPRFGILIGAMLLSICFILLDILAVTHVLSGPGLPDGINPFWKLAFVFKCLTDTIVLDDFKTALDKLKQRKMEKMNCSGLMGSGLGSDGIRADFFANFDQMQNKRNDVNLPSHSPGEVRTRDWSKMDDSEHLDLEAALRMDSVPLDDCRKSTPTKCGESSGSSGG